MSELRMKVKGNIIDIQVKPHFWYDTEIECIGTEGDTPNGKSAWSWVKHLREKRWWNVINERKFLLLAKTIVFKT